MYTYYIYILYVTQYGVNIQSRLEERERGVERKRRKRKEEKRKRL